MVLSIVLSIMLVLNRISCVPIPNGQEQNPFTKPLYEVNSAESEFATNNIDDLSKKISSITNSSIKIVNNMRSTLESTGKIVSNIIEAKNKISGPILESAASTLQRLSKKGLESSLETVEKITYAGLQTSIGISASLSRASSSIDSSKRSHDSDNNDKEPNKHSMDLGDSLVSIADSSSKIIQNLISTVLSSVKIMGDIIEAKRKLAEPILEGTAKALETLSESNAIERSLETVQTLANAGVQTSIGISSALSRVGSTTPALLQGFNSANEITVRVVRLGICTLICPHQTGDDRETCRDENCRTVDKSDNSDQSDDSS
jgi:hypothetical protein